MSVSNIKEILFLHFAGKATEQQNKKIGMWLADPVNREKYYAWLDEWEQSQLAEHEDLCSPKKEVFVTLKSIRSRWVQVAAVIMIAVVLSTSYILGKKEDVKTGELAAKLNSLPSTVATIKPASNKAYLTTATGGRIILSEVDSGTIATQAGVKICKTKDGKLVYQFGSQANQAVTAGPGVINENTDALATNTITTPRGGEYQLVLVDGTKVWLNAASSLEFPVSFKGNKRNVTLNGEAYFEVAKNKSKPFIVHSGDVDIEVLGTHFNVNAYNNGGVVTTLLEGSVRLNKGCVQKMLKPGQKGMAQQGKAEIAVLKADLNQIMAWKNGYFIFNESMSISEIMKEVSRWYDVDVEIRGDLSNKRFGGTVSRYKDIRELLNNMELTHAIHYKIQGKKVMIME